MDLSTKYMGFTLPHPFICGAGPFTESVESAQRVEEAGAAAIVMHSLFEEQIEQEAFRKRAPYFPTRELPFTPHHYLEHLHRLRQVLHIPLIASLNGATADGWLKYAEQIEDAGADGLELNYYYIPTDPNETSFEVEERVVDCATAIKNTIAIPITVKLSPFYTTPANLISRLDRIGVQGIVIFNRFYQPDVGPDDLDTRPRTHLSSSSELILRLHWVSILSGHIHASLAVTGGVHTAEDAGRALAAGAHAVQMVSALIEHGPEYLQTVKADLERWMEQHGYDSVSKLIGCLSLQNCPEPGAYERANYARVLHSHRCEPASADGEKK
jgi:dihydroorotate dehydrogenase (fumarate)